MTKVERKPKLIKNAIPDQNKTTPNSLTVKEWNYIINVLKTQTNLNTEYLDKLHYILFGSSESDFIATPSLPEVKDMFIELEEVLATIEDEFEEYQTDVNNDVQDFKDAIENAFDLYKHGINVDIENLRTVTKAQINNVIYTPANGHLTFYRQDGTDFSIDLPLELIVSSGTYEEATKTIVLTLANGDVINIPVSAILDVDGIATERYVDDQITERQAIVKTDISPLNETDLVYFMQELEEGVYKIQTELWGHEFLFVSNMNLPIDPNAGESELNPVKEYARYTSNGSSYRYDFDLQTWVMVAGGKPIHIGYEPPENINKVWLDIDLTGEDPINQETLPMGFKMGFQPLYMPDYNIDNYYDDGLPPLGSVNYTLPNLKTTSEEVDVSLPEVVSSVYYTLPNLKTTSEEIDVLLPEIMSNIDYNLSDTEKESENSLPKILGDADYNLPKL